MAHIHTLAKHERWGKLPLLSSRIKSHEEGMRLCEAVLRRLKDEATTEDWPPESEWLDACNSCPVPESDGRLLTGPYILAALRHLLPADRFRIQPWEAFVVDNRTRDSEPALRGLACNPSEYHGGPPAAMRLRYEPCELAYKEREAWELRVGPELALTALH